MDLSELIKLEEKRQLETLQMIPSENHASAAVRQAMGSVFANKYAEGYPGKRYYQGNEVVDELEITCQEMAKSIFKVPHVNVQPLSGANANLAILKALRKTAKDVQLSQHLSVGGHLSMGQDPSVTSLIMKPVHYSLDSRGEIDWDELERLATKYKPQIIWSGGTAYTKIFNWKKYAEIADKVGAFLVADISHIGGLVAGHAHPSPVPYADVVMTTTHKTLRGPRGAMILVTKNGLAKDEELAQKIDRGVFPGVQGGPHMENIGSLIVALKEVQNGSFQRYAKQVVDNARVLAYGLANRGFKLVGGGSENHMVWIDLSERQIDGWMAAWALEYAGIIANRQTVPGEKRSPYYPSGLRLGTPAVTTRGMKEKQIRVIAYWISEVLNYLEKDKRWDEIGSRVKNRDQEARKKFKEVMKEDKFLSSVRDEIRILASNFPTP